MRRNELEAKVLRITERGAFPAHVEDSALELKAEVPADFAKFARQLAGHANAAHGETIVWVFGIDEKAGVVGLEPFENGPVLDKLRLAFASRMPELLATVVTEFDGKSLQALAFSTDEAPYLVKNPMFGTAGNSVEREVPWRSGEMTASATREQLMRLLAPAVRYPVIDFHWAEIQRDWKVSPAGKAVGETWKAIIDLYIVPPRGEPLIIPTHLIHCRIEGAYRNREFLVEKSFKTTPYKDSTVPPVSISASEVVVRDAGKVSLHFHHDTDQLLDYHNEDDELLLSLRMTPVRTEWTIACDVECVCEEEGEKRKGMRSTKWFCETGPYSGNIAKFIPRSEI